MAIHLRSTKSGTKRSSRGTTRRNLARPYSKAQKSKKRAYELLRKHSKRRSSQSRKRGKKTKLKKFTSKALGIIAGLTVVVLVVGLIVGGSWLAQVSASLPQPGELVESFYKDLEFGTGGLRGIMGVGTNRMNIYTVGMATQGLCNYLLKQFKDREEIGVAVAYDCRNNSPLFAEITAQICVANGIKAYLFDGLRPGSSIAEGIPVSSDASRWRRRPADRARTVLRGGGQFSEPGFPAMSRKPRAGAPGP